MRFRHPDGSILHLSYCSNVHAADDVDGVIAQFARFAAPVRAALGVTRLAVGLWLAAPALRALVRDEASIDRARRELDRLGLEVVTLNGFPYRAFHAAVVKHDVYSPHWAEPERASYTLDLAHVLARLLPDDVDEGSISTLPLGWRQGWSRAHADAARRALQDVAEGLAKLEADTGRRIRIALEPEPGCVVETIEQAAAVLDGVAPEWIGVCIDACHLAVQFEDASAAATTLGDAGVPVVKAQVSSAVRVAEPASEDGRARLRTFVEPRFLHQVRERSAERVVGTDDLEDALGGGLPGEGEWRVHFHIPVHIAGQETTQTELLRTLAVLVGGDAPLCRHLEVETYTWTVLPPQRRPRDDAGLIAGLAEELAWTRGRLVELGMVEIG